LDLKDPDMDAEKKGKVVPSSWVAFQMFYVVYICFPFHLISIPLRDI
jgi:hypothetical protein